MKNPAKKSEKLVNYSMSVILMPFFENFWDWQNNNTCQSLYVCDITFSLSLSLFSSRLFMFSFFNAYKALTSLSRTLPFFCTYCSHHMANHSTKSAHQKFTWFTIRMYSFQFLWICVCVFFCFFLFFQLHQLNNNNSVYDRVKAFWMVRQSNNGIKVKLDRWAWAWSRYRKTKAHTRQMNVWKTNKDFFICFIQSI